MQVGKVQELEVKFRKIEVRRGNTRMRLTVLATWLAAVRSAQVMCRALRCEKWSVL